MLIPRRLAEPAERKDTSCPTQPIRSVRDVATWKQIKIGTFANPLALRNAMDAVGCNVGGQAAEILARPSFTVSSKKIEINIVTVSPAELGFATDNVGLAAVYSRAKGLGFELSAAEVGPQLRIQYFDQPIGEFLTIAMEPIKTWSGEPIILNVANGGAGLILIGQAGSADAEVPVTTRFVFTQPSETASSNPSLEQATAIPRR
ncbi:hypothetical protein [Bradyrhizobium japonicum]|uniref:hypothetical protein n=1 Tax=Bradyrhizobium japonicum TaxID=375 RepID=UPI0018AD34F2